MNGAESAIQTAVNAGIDVCFANPGTTEMPLVGALDRISGMRAVLGLFEGVITGAADGYGRMTGRPALTVLHLGPGFANGIANLHNARRADTPIVNLIGDQASWHLAADAPLTSDIASLAGPVSKWSEATESAATVGEKTANAITAALSRPRGVATLTLRADHQWEDGGLAVTPEAAAAAARPSVAHVDEIARAVRSGAAPMLLLGAAALTEAGQRAAARIRDAAPAAVLVETFPARWERGGGVPVFDKLPYFPEQAKAAIASAAPLVLVGAKSPVAFFGYPGGDSRLAPNDCITLATPFEDAEAGVIALADALEAPAQIGPSISSPAPDRTVSGPLAPGSAGEILARQLPANAIVVDEAATSGVGFFGPSGTSPRHTVLSLTGGAIGQGLPNAVGAAIACPDRKVISFQADGSGQYTVQALWTMVRENLDVLVLICANRAYRILQVELARAGIAEPGKNARSLTDLGSPVIDWVLLAQGYGMNAERVADTEAMERALASALAEGGPRLIELVL